jgi:hypothetical protein
LTEWLFTHSDSFPYHFKLDDVKDFIDHPGIHNTIAMPELIQDLTKMIEIIILKTTDRFSLSIALYLQQLICCGISKIMVDFQTVSLKVDRKDIFYVNYVVEGYDGIGIVSTKDPAQGLLTINYPEGNRAAMFDLIHALEAEGIVKEVIEL